MFIYIYIYTRLRLRCFDSAECRLYPTIYAHPQTDCTAFADQRTFSFSIPFWWTSNQKSKGYLSTTQKYPVYIKNMFQHGLHLPVTLRLCGSDVSKSIDVWESVTRPIPSRSSNCRKFKRLRVQPHFKSSIRSILYIKCLICKLA